MEEKYCEFCGQDLKVTDDGVWYCDNCGYCSSSSDREVQDGEDNMTDVEADADTLKSAGWGTDEDYGCFGSGEDY